MRRSVATRPNVSTSTGRLRSGCDSLTPVTVLSGSRRLRSSGAWCRTAGRTPRCWRCGSATPDSGACDHLPVADIDGHVVDAADRAVAPEQQVALHQVVHAGAVMPAVLVLVHRPVGQVHVRRPAVQASARSSRTRRCCSRSRPRRRHRRRGSGHWRCRRPRRTSSRRSASPGSRPQRPSARSSCRRSAGCTCHHRRHRCCRRRHRRRCGRALRIAPRPAAAAAAARGRCLAASSACGAGQAVMNADRWLFSVASASWACLQLGLGRGHLGLVDLLLGHIGLVGGQRLGCGLLGRGLGRRLGLQRLPGVGSALDTPTVARCMSPTALSWWVAW